MKDNILERLKTKCHFSEVFEDLERSEDGFTEVPRRKIGHLRADHDGRRWWNTAWPCHPALATTEIKTEIDRTYEALTAPDALKDLHTLTRFCEAHPEACVDREFRQEYNFFLKGESCDFWIRYLNAFTKS